MRERVHVLCVCVCVCLALLQVVHQVSEHFHRQLQLVKNWSKACAEAGKQGAQQPVQATDRKERQHTNWSNHSDR